MAIEPEENKKAKPGFTKIMWVRNDDEVRLPGSVGGYVFKSGVAVAVPDGLAAELLLQTENFKKGEN